jgi:hypothetical protein
MKKLFVFFFAATSLLACKTEEKKAATAEQKPATVEHIFKPTYTDNFKIGDQKNVLLAEQFHEAVFAKDYAKLGTFLVDTAVFYNEDGTTLKGKAALIDFMQKNYSKLNFKNYKVGVSIPVVGENGHEWVLMWDEADVETPDGKTQNYKWMDAYRFENGKVVAFNGFGKSPK